MSAVVFKQLHLLSAQLRRERGGVPDEGLLRPEQHAGPFLGFLYHSALIIGGGNAHFQPDIVQADHGEKGVMLFQPGIFPCARQAAQKDHFAEGIVIQGLFRPHFAAGEIGMGCVGVWKRIGAGKTAGFQGNFPIQGKVFQLGGGIRRNTPPHIGFR